jgi:aspartate aminotransferase
MALIKLEDRLEAIRRSLENFNRFIAADSAYSHHSRDPQVCDFTFGNPQELPLPAFTAALQRWAEPQNKNWFAYKMDEAEARQAAADGLERFHGTRFDPEHIYLTNGAFGGLFAALRVIAGPGDEVIFISPPWFFYEAMILEVGATPVRVKIEPHTFDLDLEAIAAVISPRTRAIIINSPNNPTGKIYPPETLGRLAQVLADAGDRNGRPILLISDESYSRIVFDGRRYPSPALRYPHSVLVYTYGKTLLAPGQRLGYIALPSSLADRQDFGAALTTVRQVTGWTYPNALMQHALPDLEKLSIDIPRLQRKRDHLVGALLDMGYEVHAPEGTFYLLPRAPIPNDRDFCNRLAENKILCLPGEIVEMPGYFRISLTAAEEMIERSLEGFEAALA